MKTLRSLIAIALTTMCLLGMIGCATSSGQRAYSQPGSQTDYWKQKYEKERSNNRAKDVVRGLETFGTGLDRMNQSLDRTNKRLDGMLQRMNTSLR